MLSANSGPELCNSNNEKILGVNFDNKLTFHDHVSELCKKASKKLHALSRISHYMNTNKRRIIMKAFIDSQFGYCPLIWMFHSRALNNKINRIQERSLRLVYDDHYSSFEELLSKDNCVTVHERNIQLLAIEFYKVINGMALKIMC